MLHCMPVSHQPSAISHQESGPKHDAFRANIQRISVMSNRNFPLVLALVSRADRLELMLDG